MTMLAFEPQNPLNDNSGMVVAIINKSLCSLTGNVLVTEASSCGFKPGIFPEFIAVVNDAGEGFLFIDRRAELHDGELMGYRYYARTADVQLLVIND